MAERRSPPPWSIENNGAYFIVCDHGGQNLPILADEDYQIASTLLQLAKKAGRIIPADPSQGSKKRSVCALLGNDKSVNANRLYAKRGKRRRPRYRSPVLPCSAE
jgi:hypothetical protein